VRPRWGALAACVALLLVSCSGKPPVIARSFARVIYVYDVAHNTKSETLGVYLVASDPDGMENLSAFYVINDDAELFWKVDKTAWVSSTAEGESWIGASTLSMPTGSPLPAGVYRVVLQNVGGDTVEDTVTVAKRAVGATEASFPSAIVQDGEILIKGTAASYEVWAYAPNGGYAASLPVTGASPRIPVKTVASAFPSIANGFTFRVFAWDEKAGFGALAGPYSSGALSAQ
jgi:hypothetical protein